MAAPKLNRLFNAGEKVKVKKKTHLLDEKREHEGIPKGYHAEKIDEKVTGIEGEIAGSAYQSPQKGGEWHIPIRVGAGGIIAVPQDRLERENNTPRTERNPEGSRASMSAGSIKFWRKYFRDQEELKRLRKAKKKG